MRSDTRAKRAGLGRYVTHALIGLFTGCGPGAGSDRSDANNDRTLDKARQEAVDTYANMVHANYDDALQAAIALEAAIDSFVAAPGPSGFDACRTAWVAARIPYGQTEAYRFGNGPIDDGDGPEGLLNAWPMDEAYVDYVRGNATAGIINSMDPAYATIDGALLERLNEVGGETNISTGYHAIEFLLWGQDTGSSGAGSREWTDYSTAPNADRRGAYLKACAGLLVRHLHALEQDWSPEVHGNYRASFTSGDPNRALSSILQGIGTLAKGELAGERLSVPMLTQDQEDEQSCFSDNTHNDIRMNALGLENVYLGRYVRTNGSEVIGTSMKSVVALVDPAVANEVESAITGAKGLAYSIPAPFDQQVRSGDPGGSVNAAVLALKAVGDRVSAAAAALGLKITTGVK